MGNTKCCKESSSLEFQINDFVIKTPIFKTYESFMNTHSTINRITNQKLANKKLNLDRLKVLSQSKEYSIPQGIFIGNSNLEGGRKNDFGFMLYVGGKYYQGYWDDDKKNGYGFYACQDGSSYIGSWKDDLASGQGVFQSEDPQIHYDGCWLNGMKEGKGIQKYADGSVYIGNFENNHKNGQGRLDYPNKTWYEGNFVNDIIEGTGKFHGINHTYEGTWKNGKMNGAGKSQWRDDNGILLARYVGEYREGIKQGFGEYTDSKGNTYKATWINGLINERGPIIKESLN